MPLLRIQNAAFGYENRAVVSGLNFEVETGDYLSIIGSNGSGKSTLLKGLLGLLTPLEGSVVASEDLRSHDRGYLPQRGTERRDFPASVREVALSGRLAQMGMRPFYSRADKEIAAHYLECMGVAELATLPYAQLSGGQQQRVLLARAMCATNTLLCLDEPTNGLDPTAAADFYEAICHANLEHHLTIIMVSHDVAAAVRYSSHILQLEEGAMNFYGTVAAYLASEHAQTSPLEGLDPAACPLDHGHTHHHCPYSEKGR
jgi:zinc transport system ATP-binding protein